MTLFLKAFIFLLPIFLINSSFAAEVTLMRPVVEKDEKEVSQEILSNSFQGKITRVIDTTPTPEKRNVEDWSSLDARALRDIECLTEAIYFESVGEPVEGQIAVANVIMNRANWNLNEREPHERHRIEFKGGICDVVAFKISRTYNKPVVAPKKKKNKTKWIQKTYTTCAFSYRCERGFHAKLQRVKKKERWNEIKELAKETYIRYNSGENTDPSQGATFYHATWMKKWPWWSKNYEKTTTIGLHVFYKIR